MSICADLENVKRILQEEISFAEEIEAETIEINLDDADYIVGVIDDAIRLKTEIKS